MKKALKADQVNIGVLFVMSWLQIAVHGTRWASTANHLQGDVVWLHQAPFVGNPTGMQMSPSLPQ